MWHSSLKLHGLRSASLASNSLRRFTILTMIESQLLMKRKSIRRESRGNKNVLWKVLDLYGHIRRKWSSRSISLLMMELRRDRKNLKQNYRLSFWKRWRRGRREVIKMMRFMSTKMKMETQSIWKTYNNLKESLETLATLKASKTL